VSAPGPQGDGPPEADPWWLKALEPFRTEEAMFKVLLVILAIFLVGAAIKLAVS
jgi:hypothetical protein